MYSLLRSVVGSSSSSSSSPNFPSYSSPRESASVFADYLRSHFSVSQPKALRRRARGYLSELCRATCPKEFYSSFCAPFTPTEFLAAASNLSSSTATGPEKVAYPMLKHLLRFRMDLLLQIFNLSWSLHSFPSIWKTFSIIPIHKMGKPLDSPASFRPISLTYCVSELCERIILSRLLFFLESNSIFSPRQASFRHGRSTLDFLPFLSPFRMGLTNPGRALGQSSLLLISPKLLTLSGIPPISTSLFRLTSLLALLAGLNLSFLTGALVSFINITKVVPFESVEVFRKDAFLALHFSLFSSMIFRLPSAALFTLTMWPFGPPPPRSLLRRRPHKELCFDWSAGLSTGDFLSIRTNVRPPSSRWIPTKPTSIPNSSYSTPASVLIPLQPFLGSQWTAFFPFLNIFLRLRPSFSHVSRPDAVSLLPHKAPLRSSSLFCIKLFFVPFSLMLHPDGFLFLTLSNSPNWNASTERLVAPSPAASRLSLFHFSSLKLFYLAYESS